MNITHRAAGFMACFTMLNVCPIGITVVPTCVQCVPPGIQSVPPGIQCVPPGIQCVPPGVQPVPPSHLSYVHPTGEAWLLQELPDSQHLVLNKSHLVVHCTCHCTYTCIYTSLFYFFQNTSKLAHLLTQAVYTPNQYGVEFSEFFIVKSRLATLF